MARETIPGRLSTAHTVRVAWRNLRRNRRRTWITATTVAIAVLLFQCFLALLTAVEQQSFDNLIRYQTAHAKLYAAGHFELRDEFPLDYPLSQLERIQEKARSVDGVAATTPRLTFSARLSDGIDQIACLGVGIQVTGSDADVFRIPQAVVAGTYLTEDEDGLLLGSGLAELFGVSAGDWLTVLAKTQAGAYEALDLPVVGLVGTGNPLIDRNSFLLPLRTAQYLLGMETAATEVAVRFAARARESATLRRLRDAMEAEGLTVKSWEEMEQDFMALVKVKRTGQGVMLGIFIVIALVGVTNTVLMAAFERTREIGMMMAMGLRGTGVQRLFLLEGGLTGLLGGALGSAVALAIIGYFASVGIDLNALYGDMDLGYPVKDVLYPAISAGLVLGCWLGTGALAAIASLYPAVRASRQDPVEALRHV